MQCGGISGLTMLAEMPILAAEREGRLQSAERAVPTLRKVSKANEPSFSLTCADSRRAVKGASYVPQSARRSSAPTASEP